jgi:3-oxoacyl-[acyl-carrier protein] reductase
VVVNYHTDREAAEAVRDSIRDEGGQAIAKGFDVTKPWEVEAVVNEILKTEGPIRILINNAGCIRDHLLMRMPDDDWHRVIDTNLHGAYYCTKAVVKSMAGKRLPGRRIINITSVMGEMGNAGQTNYSASKAGLIGFTKALARELAPMGITVNAVAPGFIETDVVKHLPLRELSKKIPLKRLGHPEEVAHVVSLLASERAGYITGQIIRVDGGLLM